jgi:glycine dehydrogenase subunit 1
MKYTPHTPEDIAQALAVIGVASVDDLFADLPRDLVNPRIDIPAGLDEAGLIAHMQTLAAQSNVTGPNFLGGGMVKRFIPSAVNALTFQSEFVTAYTPYQPEVSQGILQAMFEYQSMITELTALDVSNSSLYDGATAVAEAALLAMRQTNRHKVLVSQGVHPEYRETLQTFLGGVGEEIITRELTGTHTASSDIPQDLAAVIVQSPNFLGSIEDMQALAAAAHATGALFIAVIDPLSLAVLQAPGEYGADIAVGDGQTIGNALNFGGPAYGFIAVRDSLMRQLPGRLVGATKDRNGQRGFVLTLQAREQHIRRAKAKSNICSNHALMALQSAIYLAALGPVGLREVALASAVQANTLKLSLQKAGFVVLTQGHSFNEFALKLNKPASEVRAALAKRGIHACVPIPSDYNLGDAGLFACHEQTTDNEIAQLVTALQEILV